MRNIFLAGGLLAAILGAGEQNSSGPGKTLGNAQAPIRVDLFSDYQCPACKVFYEQSLRPMINDYVNTGKVYLVHHEYPLPMHAHAREAANYACAAERVGKYEQVGDQLFRTQDTWVKDGNVANAACSILSADEAKKVRALATTPEIATEVDGDIRAGQAEKVNGTPTMIITKLVRRYPVTGPVSYEVLRRFLDSLL